MLALYPDLVHLERAVDHEPASFPPYDVYPPKPEWTPASGTLSSPKEASKEKGEILLDVCVRVSCARSATSSRRRDHGVQGRDGGGRLLREAADRINEPKREERSHAGRDAARHGVAQRQQGMVAVLGCGNAPTAERPARLPGGEQDRCRASDLLSQHLLLFRIPLLLLRPQIRHGDQCQSKPRRSPPPSMAASRGAGPSATTSPIPTGGRTISFVPCNS